MITVNQILSRTDGGYDVFAHYFNNCDKSKSFRNHYRKDTHPSCKLYYRNGRYYMIDFGSSEWCGDCFSIAAKIFNLDIRNNFQEVLQAVASDLGIYLADTHTTPARYNVTISEKEKSKKSETEFTIIYQRFTENDLKYWEQYGITLEVLDRYNVKKVVNSKFRRCDGTNFSVYSTPENPVFAYMLNSNKAVKLYCPKSKIRFLYGGKIPSPYMFGYEQLPSSGDTLILTGGEKDVMSLASHGFNAICLNSESAYAPIDKMKELSKKWNKIMILYDSDETGIRESKCRVKDLQTAGVENVSTITLPLPGTKKEKDISDFFLLGGTAEELNSLIHQMNQQ